MAAFARRAGQGRDRRHRSLRRGPGPHLQLAGVTLVEIDRPDRKTRRWQGKSDPVDAEAAARAAQAGRATGVPKDRTGRVEALRALRVARRSAVTARADTQTQMNR